MLGISRSGPGRSWNRIPDTVREQILDMAFDRPELSPRELAVTFTDECEYFVSAASVYRRTDTNWETFKRTSR
jgi:hypothetical protein